MRRVWQLLLAVFLCTAMAGCLRVGEVGPETPLVRGRKALDAQRYAEAREAYDAALAQDSANPRARLGLGAALEGLGQLDSARSLYVALAATRLPRRVQRLLEARSELLARRELEVSARRAVANEDALSRQPPRPNTVAVLPFQYLGADSTLSPLGRGLAHLFVTDLGQIPALTLLERAQVQALLDEIGLGESGRVDPATGARSGRLLRAERVVIGSLFDVGEGERLRLDAGIVNTGSTRFTGVGSAEDRLRQLFDLEKAVLFELVDSLGIVLTPAEHQRLEERPTRVLLAFLAFSRGLEAEDRQDFAAAAAAYKTAARHDPSFQDARRRATAAAGLASAASLSPPAVSTLLDQPAGDLGLMADNLDRVMRTSAQGSDPSANPGVVEPPRGRDQIGETGGGDRVTAPGGLAGVEILVRRP